VNPSTAPRIGLTHAVPAAEHALRVGHSAQCAEPAAQIPVGARSDAKRQVCPNGHSSQPVPQVRVPSKLWQLAGGVVAAVTSVWSS
jgi:hypothetical protein